MPTNWEIRRLKKLAEAGLIDEGKLPYSRETVSPSRAMPLLPLDERPSYTPGEWLTKKVPYKPRKRDLERMRLDPKDKDYLDPINFQKRAKKVESITRGTTDFVLPHSVGDAAAIAVGAKMLGTGAKAVMKGVKRGMVNLIDPVGYSARNFMDEAGDLIFKKDGSIDYNNLYNAVVRDIPLGVAPTLGVNHWENLNLIQSYFLRRGLGLEGLPKGLRNMDPKLAAKIEKNLMTRGGGQKLYAGENAGRYDDMAKSWKELIRNIDEYQMMDPKTGKMRQYAAFNKLPEALKHDLFRKKPQGKINAYGASSGSYAPFGVYKKFRTSKSIPNSPIKGAKIERGTYEDISDFNSDIGGTFKYITQEMRKGRKLRGRGGILRDPSSLGSGYGSDVHSDLIRGIIENTVYSPITWRGEASRVVMPKSVEIPKNFVRHGKAWKPIRVFDPESGVRIPTGLKSEIAEAIGLTGKMEKKYVGGGRSRMGGYKSKRGWYIEPGKKISPKETFVERFEKSFGKIKEKDIERMMMTWGKDRKLYASGLGPASKKQIKWGMDTFKHELDMRRAFDYTGPTRIGENWWRRGQRLDRKRYGELLDRLKAWDSPAFTKKFAKSKSLKLIDETGPASPASILTLGKAKRLERERRRKKWLADRFKRGKSMDPGPF